MMKIFAVPGVPKSIVIDGWWLDGTSQTPPVAGAP